MLRVYTVKQYTRTLRCLSSRCRPPPPLQQQLDPKSESKVQSTKTKGRNLLKIDTTVLEYTKRNERILGNYEKYYPSLSEYQHLLDGTASGVSLITPHRFNVSYKENLEEMLRENKPHIKHSIMGRIKHIRYAGKKMCFINLEQNDAECQLIINFKNITDHVGTREEVSAVYFEEFIKDELRPGDHLLCVGYPGVSLREGTPSLKVTAMPKIISCRQTPLPPKLQDPHKIKNNRAVDYLVNAATAKEVIYARHRLMCCIRNSLNTRGFIEVETPILAQASNGANARPFETSLNYNMNNNNNNNNKNGGGDEGNTAMGLELRIAPELWLKKLIISGFDKIYEIGKVFRNEGVDATHNPEFSTLELYQTYITMEDLISLSEQLFKQVVAEFKSNINKEMYDDLEAHGWKFKRVEFLPTLASELQVGVDVLEQCLVNDAKEFNSIYQYIPEKYAKMGLSPQQLLNKLCGDYIEDRHCSSPNTRPCLIFHHPTLMSPLSKSTSHVSKRFEVFIAGKEYMNAYEEENVPHVQLQKFTDQQRQKTSFGDDESLQVDTEYVNTMRWGMPPTGGLGIGIDRLMMLVCNKSRIEQVLAFGTIDDVVRQ